jgi:hypothetical protein
MNHVTDCAPHTGCCRLLSYGICAVRLRSGWQRGPGVGHSSAAAHHGNMNIGSGSTHGKPPDSYKEHGARGKDPGTDEHGGRPRYV